jgi:hypothetical protein
MDARVAVPPEDEESGLLPRPSAAPRFRPPPAVWATVDGPLGPPLEEAEGHARRFFMWGFACLPFLWAINCCYFWPVLRSPAASSPAAFGPIRPCEYPTSPSSHRSFILLEWKIWFSSRAITWRAGSFNLGLSGSWFRLGWNSHL